jgi:ribosomal protein S12 methylthiotransferase accessory factor
MRFASVMARMKKIIYQSLTESALAGDLIESGLLPAGFLQNQNIEDRIPFVRLEHIHQEKQFNYPLFLVDPRYAKKPATQDTYCYKPYAWLASDSGTASGTSVVEASIHALNEIIERDAYSLFLMHAFIKPRKNKLKLIDKITIPENLRLMIADIERTYSDELMIFDMTSDIGIPSVLVSFTRQNHLFQPKGCGTSLNRAYALERALLESLQPLHIVNDELMNNQLSIMDNFAATPLLYKCAQAKVDLLYEFTQSVDFNSLPDYGHTLSLEQQLGMIKNALTSHGFDLYHHVIASEKSGFTCVKYVVPKLERFYLVQTGKFIFPGQRGVNVLNSLR